MARAVQAPAQSFPVPVRRHEGLAAQVSRRFVKHRLAVAGLVAVVAIALAAGLAPLLSPYNPDDGNPIERLKPPLIAHHLLGTDELGRDVLTRLLYAGRISLVVGFAAMTVTIV